MTNAGSRQASAELTTGGDRAIRHLRQAILAGQDWFLALLEAVRLWPIPEEECDGRFYRYLIAGEALDWMVLAERLCEAADGLLPEDEKLAFLFHCRAPIDITLEEFREAIGGTRYHQYLNYHYGVTVEEALFWAVREESRKERWALGMAKDHDHSNEVYRRVYGQSRGVLLRAFRREHRYPDLRSTSLLEMKEFTYWLFKYRLKHCDKERVASDTRKALAWLERNGRSGHSLSGGRRIPGDDPEMTEESSDGTGW